ncbi:unnamed protein product [Meganyctiphanes norvegica]|uniref:Endonuclease/exonuclease/phosphatase domain-containing protein n=1 Tax=Meganyctiphanes norvegica TaxID=48144 RepID=A0AAV2PY72_MEGNR
MGDFNLPDINWELKSTKRGPTTRFSQTFLDLFNASGFKQHIKFPTRYRMEENSLLDLIITKKGSIDNIYHKSPLGMSDHCLLEFNFKLNSPVEIKSSTQHHNNSANNSEMNWCIKQKKIIFEKYTKHQSKEWDNYVIARQDIQDCFKAVSGTRDFLSRSHFLLDLSCHWLEQYTCKDVRESHLEDEKTALQKSMSDMEKTLEDMKKRLADLGTSINTTAQTAAPIKKLDPDEPVSSHAHSK